jgi:nucleotide-binding universal stress UspA family protein
MSADSFRQVLALLHDTEHEMWRVLERAIELADTERARLTLAKTTDPGRLVRWFSPLAPLCRLAPIAEPDLSTHAARRLAEVAETVPASIPLCTVLLGLDTTASVRRLAERTPYDLVVVSATALGHDFKLRRLLRSLGVCTLSVAWDGLGGVEPEVREPLGIGAPRAT